VLIGLYGRAEARLERVGPPAAAWAARLHGAFRPFLDGMASVTLDQVARIISPTTASGLSKDAHATLAAHMTQLKAIYRELPSLARAVDDLEEVLGDDPDYTRFATAHPLPPATAGGAAGAGDGAVRPAQLHAQLLAASLAVWRRLASRAPVERIARAVWRMANHVAALLSVTGHPAHVDALVDEWLRPPLPGRGDAAVASVLLATAASPAADLIQPLEALLL